MIKYSLSFSKIRIYLFNHWQVKLASILLSIGIWIYIQNLKINILKINIPIVYRNKPKNLQFSKRAPKFVSIEVFGRDENINFSTFGIKGIVNLESASEGGKKYPIDFDENQFPDNIKIKNIDQKILLYLEKITRKRFEIRPVLRGNLLNGWRLGKITSKPAEVVIEGPDLQVNKIKGIYTLPIELNELASGENPKVQLDLDAGLRTIGTNTFEINLEWIATEQRAEKILKREIELINTSSNLIFGLSEKFAQVKLQGEANELEKITEDTVHLVVDMDKVFYDVHKKKIVPDQVLTRVPVQVQGISKNFAVLEIRPDYINVKIAIKPLQRQEKKVLQEKDEVLKNEKNN